MNQPYLPDTDIYEHGVVVVGGPQVTEMRLVATTRQPIYSGFSLSIVDLSGQSLNERAVQLFRVNAPHRMADYFEESDVRYAVLSSLYHLNRIVDLYVRVHRLFETRHSRARRGNTGDPRVFYEIDAFLGAARRVYEKIRGVLWKHWNATGSKGRWKSFRKVFDSPHSIPKPLLHALDCNWRDIGGKLSEYRNCVAHYDPLHPGHTTCWVALRGGRSQVTVHLPANPSAQSRRGFDFEGGPDALSYCHAAACHIVDICDLIQQQPTIQKYLDCPTST